MMKNVTRMSYWNNDGTLNNFFTFIWVQYAFALLFQLKIRVFLSILHIIDKSIGK